MKVIATLVLLLLVATPAYATTTGLPPIPPPAHVGNSGQEASIRTNAPAAVKLLAADPVPSGLVYQSAIYDSASDSTTFWYWIWPHGPAWSHIVLGVCQPVATTWPHSAFGYDPPLQVTGLKFDQLPELQAPLEVSITVPGERTAKPITWWGKAGLDSYDGVTLGPACGPNAVTYTTFTARSNWWDWLRGWLP